MRTAEEFRASIGQADESFRRCVCQTLTALACEEEKPVKKKISLGMVLALAVMLLTVTALAAGQWGILDFIREKGMEPPEYKLMEKVSQEQGYSRLADMCIDEALVDGDRIYLAMTVRPKTENTIIMPMVKDLAAPGGMAVMNNPDYDAGMSVRAYAQQRGLGRVIGFRHPLYSYTPELLSAVYESMEDGGLRCLLEYSYEPVNEALPEGYEWFLWEVGLVDYQSKDVLPESWRQMQYEIVQLMADIRVNVSLMTRRSRPEDAHGIGNRVERVEHISMTPLEDGSVYFTIMLDLNDAQKDELRFPVAVLVDEENDRSLVLNGPGYYLGHSDKLQRQYTIPAEYADVALADQVTIRIEYFNHPEIVYDTYTYTME